MQKNNKKPQIRGSYYRFCSKTIIEATPDKKYIIACCQLRHQHPLIILFVR
jgi:hypothetical protein